MHDDRSAQRVIREIRTKPSAYWERVRASRALTLFRAAAHRVPAYKDFLKKHNVDQAKVKTFKDFEHVPPTSKREYLRQYPLEKLLWDGTLNAPLVWTSTSGSTGQPFYFPRGEALDAQYSIIAQLFLENSSRNGKGPKLVIIGFGMGVWIGGLITYKAFEIASRRGNMSVSIITPGINKEEIFHALVNLAPHFAETVLIGYPPFIKDTIEEARSRGIDLKALHMRFLFAAESFTESFRDYVMAQGVVRNPHLDTLNIYGSADIGAMAFETPTSILLRRLAGANEHLFATLFPIAEKTPTVAQYDPAFVAFESVDQEILLTGDSALPLVRYAIGDHGAAFSASDAAEIFAEHGVSLAGAARRHGVPRYELPYVCVYERSDFSTKLYGAIIYPEHVREGLARAELRRALTGKFAMATRFNVRHDEYLEVDVEMKKGVKAPKRLLGTIRKCVVETLLKKNAEYRNNYHSMPKKVTPVIIPWSYEDPRYFKPGIKQKWVLKP